MRLLSLALIAVSLLPNGLAAQEDVAKMARLIDRQVEAKLAESSLRPASLAEDAEFLRRVTLDLTGRIPSADRVKTFLADTDPAKRAKLIDELLASPAHGRYHAYLWRDLIAKRDDTARAVDSSAFVDWLTERFNANDGWDKIVTALITAQGSFQEKGQNFLSEVPELYLIRTQLDNNKEPAPNKMASVVGNLFLGVQIQCAECHRHPNNKKWTRDDFWGLAAFFGRLRGLDENGKAPDPTSKMKSKVAKYGEADEIKIKVRAPGRGESIRLLPKGAAIEVPDKVDEFVVDHIAKGRFLEGTEPSLGETGPFRPALASWMTAQDNPFFAKAAVNRLWAQLFGRGFVNPIDDFQPDNPASHPELLDELSKDFAAHGYDRKRFFRIVCNSQTYQRSSRKTESQTELQNLFGSRRVRIMTADQLLDSLLIARGMDPDSSAIAKSKGNGKSGDRPLALFNITRGEHPFFVLGQGWTAAGELTVGSVIRTDTGWIEIEELFDTGEYEWVYNLRVADHHTYFVGEAGWPEAVWAHNTYEFISGRLLAFEVNKAVSLNDAAKAKILELTLREGRRGLGAIEGNGAVADMATLTGELVTALKANGGNQASTIELVMESYFKRSCVRDERIKKELEIKAVGDWTNYIQTILADRDARNRTLAEYRAEITASGRDPDKPKTHGHHIVFKLGAAHGSAKEEGRDSRDILIFYGINPYKDKANLVYAPNKGHSAAELRFMNQKLIEAYRDGESRSKVIELIRDFAEAFIEGTLGKIP